MIDAIFQEFIKKAPKMKEHWEVVQLFEEERQKFQEELQAYEDEIKQARGVLRDLRAQVAQIKKKLKDLQVYRQDKEEEIKQIKQELLSHQIQRDLLHLQKDKPEIPDSEQEPLPQPVEFVEIYLKDHSIAKARPAKRFFSDQLYRQYRVLLRENRMLKDRVFGLDLENSTLKIELRDLKTQNLLQSKDQEKPDTKEDEESK
ncbi:nickel-binding protein Mua [Helicobacter suis]|uniref:nickel-binding protein Mua n=1 Tax=Helicobacter suis TaxID=104628 RepID=UPI001F0C56F9|nr:nickel-binding protein Mua [Helicobacter suis]